MVKPTKPTNRVHSTKEDSTLELDDRIIEHVMPFIAKLPRDKPWLAKQMFDKATWKSAPNLYGQRISYLTSSGRLPLVFYKTNGSNSHLYWINLS